MSYSFWITPEHYDIAAQNGISTDLLTRRVRGLAWDMERATTTPPKPRTKWLGIAKANGIETWTYHYRVRAGWDREKAATTPTMSREAIVELMAQRRRKA